MVSGQLEVQFPAQLVVRENFPTEMDWKVAKHVLPIRILPQRSLASVKSVQKEQSPMRSKTDVKFALLDTIPRMDLNARFAPAELLLIKQERQNAAVVHVDSSLPGESLVPPALLTFFLLEVSSVRNVRPIHLLLAQEHVNAKFVLQEQVLPHPKMNVSRVQRVISL